MQLGTLDSLMKTRRDKAKLCFDAWRGLMHLNMSAGKLVKAAVESRRDYGLGALGAPASDANCGRC